MRVCLALLSYKRAAFAARFLRPPGFFKRAELRERPHRNVGPFENPVRRFVRLREKARIFSQVPFPRVVPIAKLVSPNILKPLEGVPTVSPEVLQRRLDFLLGDAAKQQQLHAKLREGLTPYLAELYSWERQMTDLRKIYRAQYLQKLAKVTEEERYKQYDLYLRQKKDAKDRKEYIRQTNYEEKKRKAILRDTMRIEKKVTQALELGRRSKRKIGNIYWLNKLQTGMNYKEPTETNNPSQSISTRDVISVPHLAKDLGHPVEDGKNIKHRILTGDLYFRELMKESFELMPEDAPRFEDVDEGDERSPRRQANITYSNFTVAEKLELLDKKINMLSEKIDQDISINGKCKKNLYIQLLDHLSAAKQAFMEKHNIPYKE